MELWHVWLIAAIGLFIGEIFTPGFLLASLGVGALAMSVFALLGSGIKIQILAFSIATVVTFLGVRPVFQKYLYSKESKIKTNVDALIGKRGIVVESVDPKTMKGRVVVGGENWRAVSFEDRFIEADSPVEVVRIEGTKLIVKPVIENP